ncbi:unnamed protein product [Periconia digitata]|uniref:Uncharacterized protein n=1 Tax=Periconia digitata TaxID=1303443 RepID=A0A9W4XYK2_9PLEO|nr:unnamed protein product [Periconia digitata]
MRLFNSIPLYLSLANSATAFFSYWLTVEGNFTFVTHDGYTLQFADETSYSFDIGEMEGTIDIGGTNFTVNRNEEALDDFAVDPDEFVMKSYDISELTMDARQKYEEQVQEDLKNGIYDRKGNFRIPFKKESMTIADIELDDIFQSLRDACHPTGNCETNDIELKGQLIGKGTTTNVKNVELTLSPHGLYRESHREDLLDLLEYAVRQVAECEEYTHKSPCPNPAVFCPSDSTRVKRCSVPSYWAVNLQKEEDKDEGSAPPTIETDLSLEVVDDTICEDWYDKLSEFGGMVNGHAGTGLSLWKFACI